MMEVSNKLVVEAQPTFVRQLVDVIRCLLELEDLLDGVVCSLASGASGSGALDRLGHGGPISLDPCGHHAGQVLEQPPKLQGERVQGVLRAEVHADPLHLDQVCDQLVVERDIGEDDRLHARNFTVAL